MVFGLGNPHYPWHLGSRNVMLKNLDAWECNYTHVWFEYESNKIPKNTRFPCLVYSYESHSLFLVPKISLDL